MPDKMTKLATRMVACALLAGFALGLIGCATVEEAADEGEPAYIPDQGPAQEEPEPTAKEPAEEGATAGEGEAPAQVAESEPREDTPPADTLAEVVVKAKVRDRHE